MPDFRPFVLPHLLHLLFLLLLLLTLLHVALAKTPPDLSNRRIALLHMHDDAPFFRNLGALTLANKRRYAARHGYELVAHTPAGTEGLWEAVPGATPPCKGVVQRGDSCFRPKPAFAIDQRAATFGKIKLALAACRGRAGYWMLWSDADALIVNQSVPLESVIDDRFDVLLSADWLMINAGVMAFKCSPWTAGFLERVYDAREFDSARALDQSAFQHFFDSEADVAQHIKHLPKHAINVYTEEYRPGDFLVHMAGKLYEATTAGALAIATQFDVLSEVDDEEDVAAFFGSQYLLGKYSGVCVDTKSRDSECQPDDARRLRLDEPLGYMSQPNRYRHVGLRYYWMQDWHDKYDVEGWMEDRKVFAPSEVGGVSESGSGGNVSGTAVEEEEEGRGHDEL